MDFQELLAIAQRKQERKDKEVKIIKELDKQRRNERMLAQADSRKTSEPIHVNDRTHLQFGKSSDTATKVKRIVNSNITDSSRKTNPITHPTPEISTQTALPSQLSRSQPDAHRKSCGESFQKSSNVSTPTTQRCTPKTKPPKPSFADMLELAKNNVENLNVKRKAFDDLIPCPIDSKYRSLDHQTAEQCIGDSGKLNSYEKLSATTKSKAVVSKGIAKIRSVSDGFAKTSKEVSVGMPSNRASKIKTQLTSCSISNSNGKSASKNSLQRHSQVPIKDMNRSAIALQVSSKEPQPFFGNSKESVKTPFKVSETSKLVGKAAKPKVVENKNDVKNSRILSSHPRVDINYSEKLIGKHIRGGVSPATNKNSSMVASCTGVFPNGRGIAAQLGVNFNAKPDIDQFSDDDDYESDDSFIDDSDVVESKEYARVVRDIHKALKFDPRKYKEVNPWDDLKSMEANYKDIEREEKRSSRLAAQEDALELERDLERKKQKLLRHKIGAY